MSEPGMPMKPRPQMPPMEAAEYGIVRRAHIARTVFAIFIAAGFACLAYFRFVPFGSAPLALIGFAFGYACSGKFFPDSDGYFTSRAKNFRRVRKGKEPLGEDQQQECAYFDEFRRG